MGLLTLAWAGSCGITWGIGRVQGYSKGFAYGHNAGYSLAWGLVRGVLERYPSQLYPYGDYETPYDPYNTDEIDYSGSGHASEGRYFWTGLEEEAPVSSSHEGEVAKQPRTAAHMTGSEGLSNVLFFHNTKEDRD